MTNKTKWCQCSPKPSLIFFFLIYSCISNFKKKKPSFKITLKVTLILCCICFKANLFPYTPNKILFVKLLDKFKHSHSLFCVPKKFNQADITPNDKWKWYKFHSCFRLVTFQIKIDDLPKCKMSVINEMIVKIYHNISIVLQTLQDKCREVRT